MAEKRQPNFSYHSIPATLSMCPPAVRMVVVQVWASRKDDGSWDENDTAFFPVVAIVAKQKHEYQRHYREGSAPIAPTHDAMEELGWQYSRFENGDGFVHYEPVVYDEEFEITDLKSLECENAVFKVFLAPWPPEEDATRLADKCEALRAAARAKSERWSELNAAARRQCPPEGVHAPLSRSHRG